MLYGSRAVADDAAPNLATIWQAQGVLMEVRGCTAAEAADLLQRGADDDNGLLVAARTVLALYLPG